MQPFDIAAALAGVEGLYQAREALGRALAEDGDVPLRSDHAPTAFDLHSVPVTQIRVAVDGWNKLNFKRLRIFGFDADRGVTDLAGRFQALDRTGSNAGDGEVGLADAKPLLTAWAKNPAWDGLADEATRVSFLQFVNRPDGYGARSAKLSIRAGAPEAPIDSPPKRGRKAAELPFIVKFQEGAFAERFVEDALTEAVVIARGLAHLGAAFEDSGALETARRVADDLGLAHTSSASDRALTAAVAGAIGLAIGQCSQRVVAQDWRFPAPDGCARILLSRDVVAGAYEAEAPVKVQVEMTDPQGEPFRVTFPFGGPLPSATAKLRWHPLRPEAPLFQHRWELSAPPGCRITAIVLPTLQTGWPLSAAVVRVADATPGARRPSELNPVKAAVDLCRLLGRTARTVRHGTGRLVPAYCHAFGQFMGNDFQGLRSTWQAKLFADLEFDDLASPIHRYNSALPDAFHRIFSKHGFKRPLYAREVEPITSQIARLESLFAETGQTLFLAYGTLLGAVREKGFIRHDDDIDLGWILDAASFDDMMLQRAGMIDRLSRLEELSVKDPHQARGRVYFTVNVAGFGKSVPLDVFPIWRLPDGSVHGMMERSAVRPMGDDWFKAFRREPFFDREFWIPELWEAFLQDRYGPGWRVPDASYGLG